MTISLSHSSLIVPPSSISSCPASSPSSIYRLAYTTAIHCPFLSRQCPHDLHIISMSFTMYIAVLVGSLELVRVYLFSKRHPQGMSVTAITHTLPTRNIRESSSFSALAFIRQMQGWAPALCRRKKYGRLDLWRGKSSE